MSPALKIDPARLPVPRLAPTKPVRVIEKPNWTKIHYLRNQRELYEKNGSDMRAAKRDRVWTYDMEQTFLRMYKDGAHVDDIGAAIGKTGKTVRRHALKLIKHGKLAPRPPRPDLWTEEDTEKLLRLREEGKTWAEIAKALGRSENGCIARHRLVRSKK